MGKVIRLHERSTLWRLIQSVLIFHSTLILISANKDETVNPKPVNGVRWHSICCNLNYVADLLLVSFSFVLFFKPENFSLPKHIFPTSTFLIFHHSLRLRTSRNFRSSFYNTGNISMMLFRVYGGLD